MQIVGIILIIGVVGLLFWYFKWSKQEVIAKKDTGEQRVTVVVSGAYNPNVIRAKKGEPLTIIFERKEDTACSRKVIFSDFGITEDLADFGKTEVKFIPDKAGAFTFSCEMGMYQGKLIVED